MNNETQAESAEELAKHPFGNPTWEYMRFKGLGKPREVDAKTEVSTHDLLIAILRSADSIHHELCFIREALKSA